MSFIIDLLPILWDITQIILISLAGIVVVIIILALFVFRIYLQSIDNKGKI